MTGAMGNKKQEEKIARMAEVVREHAPQANLLSVKGAFRFGISKALEANGFDAWQEVAAQPAARRKKFFASVLEHASPHLEKIGIAGSVLSTVQQALKQENETFLKSL